jgi:hypothetical protein
MATSYRRIVTKNLSEVDVATAVQDGPHAAIVYRSAEGPLKILHLAWHRDLREGDFASQHERYICVRPNLERDDSVALAGYCRRIFKGSARHNGIPYNLRYDLETRFDPDTGDLILPSEASGLNCATFVVQVFRSSGNPILDGTSWPPPRPKDIERQRLLVDFMRSNPDSRHRNPEQADIMSREIGCPRIRPEEVAGACLEDDLPARFDKCEANGHFLAGLLAAKSERLVLREFA